MSTTTTKHSRHTATSAEATPTTEADTPTQRSHERVICPVARTAEIISGKWTLLIIRDLTYGTKRFSELERSLEGISPKTLSERLVVLEREGMLTRRTYAEVPPKVEYSLTEKGQALASVIEAMRSYGSAWLDCSAQ
ncbi:MAG: helix-turn-helix domain-containing protein [Ktedonobacterales bacterium]